MNLWPRIYPSFYTHVICFLEWKMLTIKDSFIRAVLIGHLLNLVARIGWEITTFSCCSCIILRSEHEID